MEAPSPDLVARIEYSEKYMDDNYEYRCEALQFYGSAAAAAVRPSRSCSHVILPKELVKMLPKGRLLAESEWRALGVQQSRGWAHYAIHKPEPHILLFRREIGTDPVTGKVNPVLRESAIDAYNREFGMEIGRKAAV